MCLLFLLLLFLDFIRGETLLFNSHEKEYNSRVSLAQCIRETVVRFFNESGSITFSSSLAEVARNTSSQVVITSILIKLLADQYSSSIIITNPRFQKSIFPTGHPRKSENYIIQIRRDGEFGEIIKRLKNSPSWNPYARFVVMSATSFKNPYAIAKEVSKHLWKEKVTYGIVILKDTNDSYLYKVYSWYPYEDNSCGDNFDTVRNVGACSFGSIRNSYSKTWFRNKIPKTFNRCVINVNYVNIPPSVLNMTNNSYGYVHNYYENHGAEINIMNTIAQKLNLTIKYVTTSSDPKWGDININGTSGDMSLILKDQIDVLIGTYAFTEFRALLLDTSVPFMQISLTWVVPYNPVVGYDSNILKIFNYDMFALTGLVILFLAVLIWLVSRFHKNETGTYKKITHVLQISVAVLVGVGAHTFPRTSLVRYLLMLQVLFGFILDIYYDTFLTSVLTHPKSKQKYETYADICKHNLKIFIPPSSVRYLDDDNFVISKAIKCENFMECLSFVAFKGESAFLVHRSYVEYHYGKYSGKYGQPLLYIQKENMVNGIPITIFMRKGLALNNKFDFIIRQLDSSGIIKKWIKDGLEAHNYKLMHYQYINKGDPLKLKKLILIFKIMIFSHAISLIVFLLEHLYYRKIHRQLCTTNDKSVVSPVECKQVIL